MGDKKRIGVGLLGLGVVGSGVARAILEKEGTIAEELGYSLKLKRILVRDTSKPRSVKIDNSLLTLEAREIFDDPEIDIVVEVMGGESPALDYIKQALSNQKYVVTANKEVIAKYGSDLLEIAQEKGVDILYEASVGGGIPLILPLQQGLLANRITALYAIINGTTNYILSRMSHEKVSFSLALKKAQELGYAEADSGNDIEGIDAAYKLAILATSAFHTKIHPKDIYCEGIARLSEYDFHYAKELGYEIKLLAIAKEIDGAIEVRVHPAFIPQDFLLAKVSGVYNAIQIEGDLVGKVLFYGEGAGASPTSSAILADLLAALRHIGSGSKSLPRLSFSRPKAVKPISQIKTRYYLRMSVADQPGVLAQIAKTLGEYSISISSVIQKEADDQNQTAEIVIMTHPAMEQAMQQALRDMKEFPVVKEICNFIRVEG
ncbi:homoserine dehydrogenase [Chloroflexota bacterium]